MFALILSLCMAPINASGQEIGPEVCEEHHFKTYTTLPACIKGMDEHIEATNKGPFYPFDWQFSCEQDKNHKK